MRRVTDQRRDQLHITTHDGHPIGYWDLITATAHASSDDDTYAVTLAAMHWCYINMNTRTAPINALGDVKHLTPVPEPAAAEAAAVPDIATGAPEPLAANTAA